MPDTAPDVIRSTLLASHRFTTSDTCVDCHVTGMQFAAAPIACDGPPVINDRSQPTTQGRLLDLILRAQVRLASAIIETPFTDNNRLSTLTASLAQLTHTRAEVMKQNGNPPAAA